MHTIAKKLQYAKVDGLGTIPVRDREQCGNIQCVHGNEETRGLISLASPTDLSAIYKPCYVPSLCFLR